MTEPRTTFTARRPVDLIAAVPYLLGFHPTDSVVLMTFGGEECFHARVDLPDAEDAQAEVVEMLTGVVRQHGIARVALLLYTDDPWVAATFHDAALRALAVDGVEVIEILRVGHDRFHDAGDVDDPGTAYDLTTHPFTAEQVLEGTVVHRSREGLAASLRLVDATDAHAVERAVSSVVSAGGASRDVVGGARWVQRTVRSHVRHGVDLTVDDAGRMLALVSEVMLRDVAWAEMSRADAARHVDLWRDLVRRSPREHLPAAASLLAFAAWLRGDGALAWCALDRCREVDPHYSMAECVALLLEGAVPPSVWTPIAEADLPVFWSPEPEAS